MILHLFAISFLRSKFLKRFEGSSCTVINVSSLMAVESFSHFSLYCAGKAARDMMCQVLAKEEVWFVIVLIFPSVVHC